MDRNPSIRHRSFLGRLHMNEQDSMILGENAIRKIQLCYVGLTNPGQLTSLRLEFVKRCP